MRKEIQNIWAKTRSKIIYRRHCHPTLIKIIKDNQKKRPSAKLTMDKHFNPIFSELTGDWKQLTNKSTITFQTL